MFDERLASKVAEGFNIQVAFSSSALAAPSFAAAAIGRSVEGSLEVHGEIYIQSTFEVPGDSTLVGRTVGAIFNNYRIHTLLIKGCEGGHRWTPPLDVPIPAGCWIVVVGPFDRVAELKHDCGVLDDLVRAQSHAWESSRAHGLAR